jgi:hypothetical protein
MISLRHATVLACTGADPVEDATVILEGAARARSRICG